MSAIKLFSTAVVLITVNLSSLKVESAPGNVPSGDDDNGVPVPVSTLLKLVESASTGSRSTGNVPSDSRISETNDRHSVPVPSSILQKLVDGESLSESDHTRLCSIFYRLLDGLTAVWGHVQPSDCSATLDHVATLDRVVPQLCESVESQIAEQPRSTRVYCPPDDEAQGPQSEVFSVQSTQTGDGLEVLDSNGRPVVTINASEHCARNPTTDN